MRRFAFLVFLWLAWLGPLPARADAPGGGPAPGEIGSEERPLVVGVAKVAPFVVANADGSFNGISVDVFRQVANGMGLKYTIREVDFGDVDKPATRSALDVFVSRNISATAEDNYDMSQSFYTTGLAIATRQVSASVWSDLATSVFTRTFLRGVGILLAVVMVMGGIVWWHERHKNVEDFGGHPVRGILGGVFWTVESLFGKSKSLTRTGFTRILTLLWVFATTLLISGVTAKLSAEFTVNKLRAAVNGPADLPKVRVGAIRVGATSTTAAEYLEQRDIPFRVYPDNERLLDGLAAGEVDAVVSEAPILRYHAEKRQPGAVIILPGTFRNHGYGFAFRLNSPLLKAYNRALLRYITTEDYKATLSKYLHKYLHASD